jgi:hypothetical protein
MGSEVVEVVGVESRRGRQVREGIGHASHGSPLHTQAANGVLQEKK